MTVLLGPYHFSLSSETFPLKDSREGNRSYSDYWYEVASGFEGQALPITSTLGETGIWPGWVLRL